MPKATRTVMTRSPPARIIRRVWTSLHYTISHQFHIFDSLLMICGRAICVGHVASTPKLSAIFITELGFLKKTRPTNIKSATAPGKVFCTRSRAWLEPTISPTAPMISFFPERTVAFRRAVAKSAYCCPALNYVFSLR